MKILLLVWRFLVALHPPILLAAVSYLLFNILPAPGSYAAGVFFIVMVFDIAGRSKLYFKLLENQQGGVDPRVWRYHGRSWCGRSVVTALFPGAKDFYYGLGYRWYHIFPDGAFSRDPVFFRRSFWKSFINP